MFAICTVYEYIKLIKIVLPLVYTLFISKFLAIY